MALGESYRQDAVGGSNTGGESNAGKERRETDSKVDFS